MHDIPRACERSRPARELTMLLFKKKFLDPIRTGTKTQTIRVWKCAHVRAGQTSYIPGVGKIRITSVAPVDLSALTPEDARLDGFDTADSLRQEIADIYGEKLQSGYRVFKIGFEVSDAAPKGRPAKRRPTKSG